MDAGEERLRAARARAQTGCSRPHAAATPEYGVVGFADSHAVIGIWSSPKELAPCLALSLSRTQSKTGANARKG